MNTPEWEGIVGTWNAIVWLISQLISNISCQNIRSWINTHSLIKFYEEIITTRDYLKKFKVKTSAVLIDRFLLGEMSIIVNIILIINNNKL